MQKEGVVYSSPWPTWKTICLFVLYLIIALFFYYRLSQTYPATYAFGFLQVVFALVGSIVFTTIYSWISAFMYGNKYLGLIIGLLLTGAMVYALFLEFYGPNTAFFAITGSVVTIVYLLVSFYQARKSN